MHPLKAKTCLLLLLMLLPIAALVGLLSGPVFISPAELWHLYGFGSGSGNAGLALREKMIIEIIRLPRLVLSLLVGGLLAVCGAVLQGLFRNPLADPALIGVSAGASLGASSVIVFGALLASPLMLGLPLVSVGAFAGAVLVSLLVFRLATTAQGTSVTTMLLVGIAISALAGAANNLFSFFADDTMLRRISLWTMGSLDNATWPRIAYCAAAAALLAVLLPREAQALNAMLLGESEARHLGVEVEWLKRRLIIYAALGVSVSVAVAGVIGFVGLMVPHLMRLLIGPDHRGLLPASALAGAILLVLADALARVVVSPSELPVGVVTALLGAPFFLWLLVSQRGRNGL